VKGAIFLHICKRQGRARAVLNAWPHPSGTPVIVTLGDGTRWKTRTRSEAWTLPNGRRVVLIEGRSGGYSLERVCADGVPGQLDLFGGARS
jgi:hypothetical protein